MVGEEITQKEKGERKEYCLVVLSYCGWKWDKDSKIMMVITGL